MGERRNLRGAKTVMAGLGLAMGSAVLVGTATASADASDADTTTGRQSASVATRSAPAQPRRTATAPRQVARVVVRAAAPAQSVGRKPAAATDTTSAGALLVGALGALGSSTGTVRSESTTATAAVATESATTPVTPGYTNGVTGVQTGHSRLELPGAFIGQTVTADWYFPTQADGSIDAQGVIWLQHGFAAMNSFYSVLAEDLAQQTNSIVVAPTLASLPLTFSGGCLTCASSEQAAAALFLDPDRTTLIDSALAAGYTGDVNELKGTFVLTGHSAGGGFATAVAADYLGAGSDAQDANLKGVVMFDGVSNGASDGSFTDEVDALIAAGTPIYTIAAPAQAWNAFGGTTNALAEALDGAFAGVVLSGGSHVDSMIGSNPIIDFVLQLVTAPVPAGNTAAVFTLSSGWINDMFAGATPATAQYGFYAGANEAIIMGPTAALALPTPLANQLSFGDRVLTSLIDAVGDLFGIAILPTPYNYGSNGLSSVVVPPLSNGVTGVRTGSAVLNIPCGPDGYAAPADWYFPTQADGTVAANGIIWLQHGRLANGDWYTDMAQQLAAQTNSIVVTPSIFWFDTPLCPGCYLGGTELRQAVATMFEGTRSALNVSANAAGLQGVLPESFILAGHSAGGNFATVVGAMTVANGTAENLLGVVMFDGTNPDEQFLDALVTLADADIPDYQIAAPAQRWNDTWGAATEAMTQLFPDRFNGVQIDQGAHSDSVSGNLFADILSAVLIKASPPGGKAAVRTFATGWVNDIYAGNGPSDPFYGIYGNPNDGTFVANQVIAMGRATATTLPAPPPVDLAQYAGTWYEQGSVKLPFEWFLVNTTATYTPDGGGNIRVQNAGNLFGATGPQIGITGTAVSVNAANTRLNVGFFFGTPGSAEPGNYWVLDYAPDYRWAIVSDPSGFSGYILARDQTFRTDDPDQYDQLVTRARQLGVWGPITPTAQFPTAGAGEGLPGPATLPAGL